MAMRNATAWYTASVLGLPSAEAFAASSIHAWMLVRDVSSRSSSRLASSRYGRPRSHGLIPVKAACVEYRADRLATPKNKILGIEPSFNLLMNMGRWKRLWKAMWTKRKYSSTSSSARAASEVIRVEAWRGRPSSQFPSGSYGDDDACEGSAIGSVAATHSMSLLMQKLQLRPGRERSHFFRRSLHSPASASDHDGCKGGYHGHTNRQAIQADNGRILKKQATSIGLARQRTR